MHGCVPGFSELPPLVTSWEIESLKTQLAEAARGERFLLQADRCGLGFRAHRVLPATRTAGSSSQPVAAVPTLAALALAAPPGEGPVVALLDARRGEVYAAGYAAPGQLEPEVLAAWAEMDLFGRLHGITRTDRMARIEQVLAEVDLAQWRDHKIGAFSKGMKQRLALAQALMNEPELLLLDEPTAGINPTLINGLIDRMKRANTEFGITLFVIEHNMRVVMNLADSIYCLAHGELLAHGTPDQIQNDQNVIDAYLGAH